MIVLGIDTSAILGGVALADGVRLLGEVRSDARVAASERILVQVDRLLGDFGLAAAAVTRIAVALGPGSFTGLRVGLATAKGLAAGLQVPVAGVSALHARAHALGSGPRAVLVVTAPRRGEVFCGAGWRDDDGFHAILGEAARGLSGAAGWVGEALQVARELGKLPVLGIGEGMAALLEELGESGADQPLADFVPLPGAGSGAAPGSVALIGAQVPQGALLYGTAVDALLPVYMRGSGASGSRPA